MSLPVKKGNAPDFYSDFGVEATQGTQAHKVLNGTQRNTEVLIGCEAQTEYAALLKLPLKEYLEIAYQLAEQKHDAADYDIWHSDVYFYAWFAKAHPEVRGLPSDKATKIVKAAWDDVSWDESDWVSFMTAWDAVQYPAGSTPLGEAWRLAAQYPLSPTIQRGAMYALLVSIACHLQLVRRSKGSFFLSCRAIVAPLLGCHFTTASELLRFAVKDGYLTVVKKASPSSKKGGDATEYRFPIEGLSDKWSGWERWG